MAALPGQDKSLWLDTTEQTNYSVLTDTKPVFDVLVAGGGISGILAAWLLQNEGYKTAVIEKDRIIENTTGNTTAKLTSQHNLVYDYLISQHGKAAARVFGKANQQAIEDIDAVARLLGIPCDLERAPAYVYTMEKDRVEPIRQEVAAAKNLGLPAVFTTKTDLPYEVRGAIRFNDQAQFHPRKFLLAVAADFVAKGGQIFERTEALDIRRGKNASLITKKGRLKAANIVVATKYPFWRPKIFEPVTWVKLSYALGVLLKDQRQYPRGMYITAERPVRTIRSAPYKNGRLLIFGGESHKMTKNYDKNRHYRALVEDVKQKYQVKRVVYRWVAGDMMPRDRLPYIGPYPGEDNIHVVTGFHAWGLTWGMIAAQIIVDTIAGKSRLNPVAKLVTPDRLN